MKDLRIAPVAPDMLPEIGRLFETAFERPFSRELYLWRFLENPFGPPMAVVAFDGDRMVAHYGVCPVITRTPDEGSILGALSMTTMTDPAFQGRGLFVQLAELLYARVRDEHGCRIVLGFPNAASHYGFTHRLGWRDVHAVFFMSAPITAPAEGKGEARTEFRVLDWSDLASILEAHDRAINAFQPCARSPEFVAWRYGRCPVHRYTALVAASAAATQTAVIVKEHHAEDGSRTLDIVDVLGEQDESAIAVALRAAIGYGRAHGFSRIEGWVDLHHPVFPVLERLRLQPAGPIRYFGVRWLSDAPAEGTNPQAWRIAMGDSDVF